MTIEAFGVGLQVTTDAEHIGAVTALLPPGSRPVSDVPDAGRFALLSSEGSDLLAVEVDGLALTGPLDAAVAVSVLATQVSEHVALHAPAHIFVRSGVVAVGDRVMLLPGTSFVGKTTLVSALVGAGADYWSDTFAAIDVTGAVHPYPTPVTGIPRTDGAAVARIKSDSTNDKQGGLQVGLVAIARYQGDAVWTPRECSPGEGAIKLLQHAPCASVRPAEALKAVRLAIGNAMILEGVRGDAHSVARQLKASLG